MQDRIELNEAIELEQYEKKQLKPLDLSKFASESRFKVKKVSNPDHAKKTALAAEIKQAWGIVVFHRSRFDECSLNKVWSDQHLS